MADILTTFKPIYIFSKLLGHATYKIMGKPNNRKIVISPRIIFFSVIIYLWLGMFSSILPPVNKNANMQKIIVYCIFIYSNVLLNSFSTFLHVFKEKHLITCLNILINTDTKLFKLGVDLEYYKDRNKLCIFIGAQYLILVIDVILLLVFDAKYPILSYFYLIVQKSIAVVLFIQIQTWTVLIKTRLNLLKTNFIQNTKNIKNSVVLKDFLGQSAKIHEELCSVLRSINVFYSKPMLIAIILCTVSLIIACYDIIMITDDLINIFLYCTSISTLGLFFFVTVYCLNEVTNAVSVLVYPQGRILFSVEVKK